MTNYIEDVFFIETDTLFWINMKADIGKDERDIKFTVKRIYFEDIPEDLWTKVEGLK